MNSSSCASANLFNKLLALATCSCFSILCNDDAFAEFQKDLGNVIKINVDSSLT